MNASTRDEDSFPIDFYQRGLHDKSCLSCDKARTLLDSGPDRVHVLHLLNLGHQSRFTNDELRGLLTKHAHVTRRGRHYFMIKESRSGRREPITLWKVSYKYVLDGGAPSLICIVEDPLLWRWFSVKTLKIEIDLGKPMLVARASMHSESPDAIDHEDALSAMDDMKGRPIALHRLCVRLDMNRRFPISDPGVRTHEPCIPIELPGGNRIFFDGGMLVLGRQVAFGCGDRSPGSGWRHVVLPPSSPGYPTTLAAFEAFRSRLEGWTRAGFDLDVLPFPEGFTLFASLDRARVLDLDAWKWCIEASIERRVPGAFSFAERLDRNGLRRVMQRAGAASVAVDDRCRFLFYEGCFIIEIFGVYRVVSDHDRTLRVPMTREEFDHFAADVEQLVADDFRPGPVSPRFVVLVLSIMEKYAGNPPDVALAYDPSNVKARLNLYSSMLYRAILTEVMENDGVYDTDVVWRARDDRVARLVEFMIQARITNAMLPALLNAGFGETLRGSLKKKAMDKLPHLRIGNRAIFEERQLANTLPISFSLHSISQRDDEIRGVPCIRYSVRCQWPTGRYRTQEARIYVEKTTNAVIAVEPGFIIDMDAPSGRQFLPDDDEQVADLRDTCLGYPVSLTHRFLKVMRGTRYPVREPGLALNREDGNLALVARPRNSDESAV